LDYLSIDSENEEDFGFGIQFAINFFNGNSQMFTIALLRKDSKVSIVRFYDKFKVDYFKHEQ
jgi:hypothetical protein